MACTVVAIITGFFVFYKLGGKTLRRRRQKLGDGRRGSDVSGMDSVASMDSAASIGSFSSVASVTGDANAKSIKWGAY